MSQASIKKVFFGIRIENLVYVKKTKNNLHFENLTFAPIETDLINYELLNKNEKIIYLNIIWIFIQNTLSI